MARDVLPLIQGNRWRDPRRARPVSLPCRAARYNRQWPNCSSALADVRNGPMLANLSEGDIRLLKVFAKVVEAGGFSAAQIELNVSQSTISTHMTALEHRLGVRLCQRGRSGFKLTEKGQLIYQ